MKKDLKPIYRPNVILVKEKYGLTYVQMGKLIGAAPTTISNWVHYGRKCTTSSRVHKKFKFLYKHFNSNHKWLIKFLVRFV